MFSSSSSAAAASQRSPFRLNGFRFGLVEHEESDNLVIKSYQHEFSLDLDSMLMLFLSIRFVCAQPATRREAERGVSEAAAMEILLCELIVGVFLCCWESHIRDIFSRCMAYFTMLSISKPQSQHPPISHLPHLSSKPSYRTSQDSFMIMIFYSNLYQKREMRREFVACHSSFVSSHSAASIFDLIVYEFSFSFPLLRTPT